MRTRTYISLFSSAGVGCYGFKEQGFGCIATSELLEKRLDIQRFNQKCKYETGYISGDISLPQNQAKIFEEIQRWKDNDRVKEVDVIIATPPCQGMSVANHKKKDEIGRNSLILESISLVQKILPRYFVFENVRAFLNTECVDTDGKRDSIGNKIKNKLGTSYNIEARVINFKDYGANSSRTRTLVIGVRKDLLDITPYDIFPKQTSEKTLREVIGKFPSLTEMGEISSEDIYHSFRNYDKRMLPWVIHTLEGHSAFDNICVQYRPHSIKSGKIVLNINKNGDKYRRCEWDKVMPCVHTRNDILASQSTIHPRDNRVFSIRELMALMNIPDTFKWTSVPFKEQNSWPLKRKQEFLRKEEMNIRQSIGEAVPTCIFSQIARNICRVEKDILDSKQIKEIITKYKLGNRHILKDFVKNNPLRLSKDSLSKIIEVVNINRDKTAAFYTPKSIIFDIVNNLPTFKSKTIKILEPSVGVGNFIPLLCEKYRDKHIDLDVVDIDEDSIELLKLLMLKRSFPNLSIRYFNVDFLDYQADVYYDLVIGNPPFGKITNKQLLYHYREEAYNQKTTNIFAFFIEKSKKLGRWVSLIMPKSVLTAPEFDATRSYLQQQADIHTIIDFGESGFPGVKIETIMLLFSSVLSHRTSKIIQVSSYITKKIYLQDSQDVFDEQLGFWVIYTNQVFRKIKKSLYLNVFSYYRDRSITKKHTMPCGKIRVLKSRNIGNNCIVDIPGYDAYLNNLPAFPVSRLMDTCSILVPNLSYNPRACFLPKGMIADGSVAILHPQRSIKITEKDLNFFASEEFKEFYKIGRNLGTRSLNIDRNSVKLWGIKRG